MLPLALGLLVLSADPAKESDCMVANQADGFFKDGKLDEVEEHKGATVLCIIENSSGLSFNFSTRHRKWTGEMLRAEYMSPPLKDYSGAGRDNRHSASGPNGHKYVLRRRPDEISGCVYSESYFACATVSGKLRKPNPKPDAGLEDVGKTF